MYVPVDVVKERLQVRAAAVFIALLISSSRRYHHVTNLMVYNRFNGVF